MMQTSDRDALWDLIDDLLPEREVKMVDTAGRMVDAIEAEGWRPPLDVIDDPAVLDALPGRSIVVGRNEEAWQLTSHNVIPHPGANWGSPYLFSDRLTSRQLLDHVGPVTVVFTPTKEADRG
ncbi:hypothetical protein [Nocardia sp. NPDC055049]